MGRTAAAESVFHAIADPNRRALLDLLECGERAVNELVAAVDLSQPLVSKHLRVLREAGLVRARKDGRRRLYSLLPEPLREVSRWIEHYEHFWTDRLEALDRYLEETP